MADVGRLQMSFNSLSIRRPLTPRALCKLKATILCSTSDTGKLNKRGLPQPARRSSRGRTRKSLGLEEAQPVRSQPAEISPLESVILKERERDGNQLPSADGTRTPLHNSENKNYGGMVKSDDQVERVTINVKDLEMKSVLDWKNRNKPPAETSESETPKMDHSNQTRQWIQDMINADLERRYKSDDDDDCDTDGQDPLFIEEDDPYWLDEPDDGWGYKISDIFKEDFGVKNRKKHTDDDDDAKDVPDVDWDFQPENFCALDVDSMNWTQTVLADPSPLVALIYERYGKKGRECYHLLRELEDAANRMWECKRLPPRLVKINATFEEDLVAAIGIKDIPTLLFVKGGKLIHHQSGYLTAEDLLRIISYFYHGAARPSCLKVVPLKKKSAPHNQ